MSILKNEKKKIIKTPNGIEVDETKGEVIDDHPIDFEHPEYRIFDFSDYLRKAHHHPLKSSAPNHANDFSYVCRDEDSINKVLDKVLPGLVAILRNLLLMSLCSSETSQPMPGFEAIRRVIESRLSMSIGEATAYDLGGFIGLVVFRCLKNIGLDEDKIIESLKNENYKFSEDPIHKLAKDLKDSILKSFNNVLVRWVSRPSEDIDLEFASRTLNTPIKRARRALQIVTKIEGLGIQITSRKIDISAYIKDRDRVLDILNKLSRRLGIELSAPQPMVATLVLKLPFEIDLENLKRFGNAISQGARMKIEGSYWTALIFRKTINIYINLQGNIEKFKSATAEALPNICRYIDSSSIPMSRNNSS